MDNKTRRATHTCHDYMVRGGAGDRESTYDKGKTKRVGWPAIRRPWPVGIQHRGSCVYYVRGVDDV